MFPLKDDNPTDSFPFVTIALIVANVLMYLLFQDALTAPNSPDAQNVSDYGAIPCETTGDCRDQGPASWPVTLFTSMFMHGGLLHLGGNMLFLWVFGNNVEDRLGPVRFLAFYLLGGLAAHAGQIAVDPSSDIPSIGASGAVAAVLGGYLVLHPRAKVYTLIFVIFFFTIVAIPAMVFLVIWFAQQALFGYFDLTTPSGDGGGVAYFAHIGGFVCGLLTVKLLARSGRSATLRT